MYVHKTLHTNLYMALTYFFMCVSVCGYQHNKEEMFLYDSLNFICIEIIKYGNILAKL